MCHWKDRQRRDYKGFIGQAKDLEPDSTSVGDPEAY